MESILTLVGTLQVIKDSDSNSNIFLDIISYFQGFVPGFVSSILGYVSSVAMLSATSGARTSLYCALQPGLASGGYYSDCKEAWTSKLAQDSNNASKLWDISKDIVQIK